MNYEKVSQYTLIVYSVMLIGSIYLFCSMAENIVMAAHGFPSSVSGASQQFAWSGVCLGPMLILSLLLANKFRRGKDYKSASLVLLLPLINLMLMMGAILQEPALLNLELLPDPAEVYFSQGADYARTGDHEQAVASYINSIEHNPNTSYVYRWRGDSYFEMGRYEQALADYTKTIELDPKDAWSYKLRGDIYYELGKYEQAEADYTQVTELNDPRIKYNHPRHWEMFYVKRAIVHDVLGKPDLAALDFAKAVEFSSYNNVAWLLAHDLDTHYEQALEFALRSVERDPQPHNHDTLALVYYKLKQYEKAIEHYTITLSLDAESESYKRRGDAYLALGDKQAALADYQTYLAKEPHGAAREEVEEIIKSLSGFLAPELKDK